MASPVLALPAAGEERPTRVLPMGVLLLGTSGIMIFGALIAAYLHLRRLTEGWPPRGVRIDEYIGNLLVITMVLGAVTMEWAAHALRRGERRQTSAALSLTVGLGLAFLNLVSYTAGRMGFDAADHPYGLVVTAMGMLIGITVGVAVSFVTLTLFRVAGAQVSAAEPDQVRAAAWYWHFATAASVAVWYTVFVLK